MHRIKDIADKYAASLWIIGRTGSQGLRIMDGKRELVNLALEKINKEWVGALRRQIDRSY